MWSLFLLCSSLCLFFWYLFRKGKTSSGTIRFRCVLGERRTFVYYNPEPCEIVYYIGQKIQIVTEEPLYEIAEDVTFVCFDDSELAKKVARWFFGMGNNRVLAAKFRTYNAGLKKHIVCFDRFDGFLADLAFLARLANPNSSHTVPGNPNEFVQHEIKELSKALEHMHSQGLSSKTLHLPIGYVWCQGNSGDPGQLKIIMLDFEEREEYTSEQWNKMIARDVKRFGTVLDTYFLNTDVVWPQKDSFLRCFSMRLPDENRRLPMIRHHPFLENNIGEIFKIFRRVHRDLRAADPSDRDVLRLRKLMAALNGRQFQSEFMPNGQWTRQEMSPQFNAFLRGNCEPPSNSVKYNTEDLGDLLRFLRNLSENFYHSMSLDFMFEEVGRYWPHLIDRFYEKIAALSGSRY